MSNPAVITLAEVNTSCGQFRVEDNIGEAIHFHLGDIRIDLSVEEFRELAEDMYKAMKVYFQNISGFNLDSISREFLLQRSECWNDLTSVKMERVQLGKLLVDVRAPLGFVKYADISKSRVTKALQGLNEENDKRNERNYFGQTNRARLNVMLEKIRIEGYNPEKGCIVLFNNRNNIIDGQHRAACLYHLYGDIEVSVQRMYFAKGKHSAVAHPILERIFRWDKKRVYILLRNMYRKLKKLKKCIMLKVTGLRVRLDIIKYKER